MEKFSYMHSRNNRSAGINTYIRDTVLAAPSVWNKLQPKKENDMCTDLCILYPYRILRTNGPEQRPILTMVGNNNITTPLGEEVAEILVSTKLTNIEIVQYSINANRVGKEDACNHLSILIYAHLEEPRIYKEVIDAIFQEMQTKIICPIREILTKNNASIFVSSYDFGLEISSRDEMNGLLIYGEKSWHTDGHFFLNNA